MLGDRSFIEQPRELSSIAPFPRNTQVRTAALWSLRCILDGKPPFDLRARRQNFKTNQFPESEFARMATWWKINAKESRYSFGGK